MPNRFYIDQSYRMVLPKDVRLFRRRQDDQAFIYAALPANGVGSKRAEQSLNTSSIKTAIKEAQRLYDERLARLSQGLPEARITVQLLWERQVRSALRGTTTKKDKARLRHWTKFIVPTLRDAPAGSLKHADFVKVLTEYVEKSVDHGKSLKQRGKRCSFRIHENGIATDTAAKFIASLRWGLKLGVEAGLIAAVPPCRLEDLIKDSNKRLNRAQIYDRQDNQKRLKLHQTEAGALRTAHARLTALLRWEALKPALKDPSRPHERFSNKYLSQRRIRSQRVSAHKPFADLSSFELHHELTRSNSRFRFAITAFLIELISQTGIRPQEAKLLTFGDFAVENGHLTIKIREEVGKKRFDVSKGKSNARSVIPRSSQRVIAALTDFSEEWLYRHNYHPRPTSLLFESPRSGRKNQPMSLHQTVKFALETLGVETMRIGTGELATNQILTLYSFRSLYITEMRDAQVPDRLIAANAGTSIQMIEKIYDTFSIEDHRSALEVPVRRLNVEMGSLDPALGSTSTGAADLI